VDDWSFRKAALNHDWLRNVLLVLLGAVRNVSKGNVMDSTVVGRLRKEMDQWGVHRIRAAELIDSFEIEMSPVVLFSQPPLSNCDSKIIELLPNIVHANWLHRFPVHEWLAASRECLEQTDHAFNLLRECDPQNVSDLLSPRCLEALNQLTKAAGALSDALSRLPNRILV